RISLLAEHEESLANQADTLQEQPKQAPNGEERAETESQKQVATETPSVDTKTIAIAEGDTLSELVYDHTFRSNGISFDSAADAKTVFDAIATKYYDGNADLIMSGGTVELPTYESPEDMMRDLGLEDSGINVNHNPPTIEPTTEQKIESSEKTNSPQPRVDTSGNTAFLENQSANKDMIMVKDGKIIGAPVYQGLNIDDVANALTVAAIESGDLDPSKANLGAYKELIASKLATENGAMKDDPLSFINGGALTVPSDIKLDNLNLKDVPPLQTQEPEVKKPSFAQRYSGTKMGF
uniref:hypothetical protein n=1 Tax=Vibrio crassostreae TaxID=246167 RepID=UPI001B30206B